MTRCLFPRESVTTPDRDSTLCFLQKLPKDLLKNLALSWLSKCRKGSGNRLFLKIRGQQTQPVSQSGLPPT